MNKKAKTKHLLNCCAKQIENFTFRTLDNKPIIFKNIFLCPICLSSFNLEKIEDNELQNLVSLEDVPPKSIGGKPILVTCKECNNICGHDIDVFLLNELRYREDIKTIGYVGKKAKVSFEGTEVNAILKQNSNNTLIFEIKKENDPRKVNTYFKKIDTSGHNWTLNAQITLSDVKRNPSAANIAIIKSAYLLAFKSLGYYYILDSKLDIVREQIRNPKEQIIAKFIVGDEHYMNNDITDGVYRAYYNDTEILMVIFSFKLKQSDYIFRRAVALPPINLKTDIYSIISKNSLFSISIIEKIPIIEKYAIK